MEDGPQTHRYNRGDIVKRIASNKLATSTKVLVGTETRNGSADDLHISQVLIQVLGLSSTRAQRIYIVAGLSGIYWDNTFHGRYYRL